MAKPIVLTIAGSDSGGGAGIQADLKTFEAHGVFGTSALTAITAQNTRGVRAVHNVPLPIIEAQLDALFDDLPPAAIKIGMLATSEIIELVARKLEGYTGPVVLDPVMVATSGDVLLAREALGSLQQALIPRATLITPNASEAALLHGELLTTLAHVDAALAALAERHPAVAILIKGGHLLKQYRGTDTLLHYPKGPSEKSETQRYVLPHLPTDNTHGTGCTLSSAIAARLALGHPLPEAVRFAKAYVHQAIKTAPGLGHGHGPLNHHLPFLPQ